MDKSNRSKLEHRVISSAQRILKHDGAVGPIELLIDMSLIPSASFAKWKHGSPEFRVLEDQIQCGDEKLRKTFRFFSEWVEAENLEPFTAEYQGASRSGSHKLQVLADEDPKYETFLLTRYQRRDLTPARKKQIQKKLTKVPDLTVFILTGEGAKCIKCAEMIETGDLMYREDDQPLCLACAEFDHLEFLPSGDATLTRRSKKFAKLSAVVVQFNRRRKRYERRGLLVGAAAIDQARESMLADADKRSKQREVAAIRRVEEDAELVQAMVQEITTQFPSCPRDDALRIAKHTAQRGSGRVGRSAAGRDVDSDAIKLAVIAHIRHEHTPYDEMLMDGVARRDARTQIQDAVAAKLDQWRSGDE